MAACLRATRPRCADVRWPAVDPGAGLKPGSAAAADADAGPANGDLTLEAYADQLKRARQLSGLSSLLPKGAMAAAGGSDASVSDTLKRQEDIVRCVTRPCARGGTAGARPLNAADVLRCRALTPAEAAAPLSSLSAAARERIAQQVGCTPKDVADALAKYTWVKAAMARMAAMKASGQPMPKSFDELEVREARAALTAVQTAS